MFKNKKKKIQKLDQQQKKGTTLITVTKPNSVIAEQFRTIRTNIQFSMIDKDLKTILFTSSGPYEGKSTVAANIASVFSDQGKKVCLIDADMRKPTVNKTFGLQNNLGLSSLITSRELTVNAVAQTLEEVGLDIITSGPIPPNPSELLNSNRMNEVIKELEQEYDLVLFDMPPVVSVTDAQIMATKTDGVVFVVRRGIAYTDDVKHAKELLDMVHANVLGVVFNGTEKKNDRSYSYYGYGYTDEE
ncbi:CpsD/CapB family tyrosine-protein kinase [Jeotgalibaca arthritidis]|uniref:non-specific protein-tyrosine kinase n=1 Tax=Jeotgalibaca arthritidis TaxID=1868794 RepID=A0A6G7KAY3_9LACT|nr:CpsD/CapB family tyrosine-protein kinase [Jeotgalibaca arthritidis]QII82428.1 CpsD/CapB family tyrosine-protein kinase [Jeotgalibaca arthritidis]